MEVSAERVKHALMAGYDCSVNLFLVTGLAVKPDGCRNTASAIRK